MTSQPSLSHTSMQLFFIQLSKIASSSLPAIARISSMNTPMHPNCAFKSNITLLTESLEDPCPAANDDALLNRIQNHQMELITTSSLIILLKGETSQSPICSAGGRTLKQCTLNC